MTDRVAGRRLAVATTLLTFLALLALPTLSGCGDAEASRAAHPAPGAPAPGAPAPGAPAPAGARGAVGTLVAAFRVPGDAEIPEGALGASVRRGRALLAHTRDSLPAHVGNGLRCTSCHLDGGRRADAIPWVGVYARFPQYRSRNDRTNTLEDRVNDCFERSLNGTALPTAGRDMRDVVAYLAFLSRGIPVGSAVAGQGLRAVPPLPGDTARGASVFAARCMACHGGDGQGTPAAPPLWGPASFNVGAGMARLRTAAAFIRHNMPLGAATLSDQEAYDVAAFVTSRPRPDFVGKEDDWPRGDAPPDAAYRTRAARLARPE